MIKVGIGAVLSRDYWAIDGFERSYIDTDHVEGFVQSGIISGRENGRSRLRVNNLLNQNNRLCRDTFEPVGDLMAYLEVRP
ncbi:MAG: hypothetical protein R2827_15300 [Bdellovibrionales bacterium]